MMGDLFKELDRRVSKMEESLKFQRIMTSFMSHLHAHHPEKVLKEKLTFERSNLKSTFDVSNFGDEKDWSVLRSETQLRKDAMAEAVKEEVCDGIKTRNGYYSKDLGGKEEAFIRKCLLHGFRDE